MSYLETDSNEIFFSFLSIGIELYRTVENIHWKQMQT